MATKVALHRVILGREHPTKKDKHGKPVQQNVHVHPGQSYDFNDDEVKELEASGAIRDPINEGGESAEDAAIREAVDASREGRSYPASPRDAAAVARAGARGQGARKQPSNTDKGEAEEEEDAL